MNLNVARIWEKRKTTIQEEVDYLFHLQSTYRDMTFIYVKPFFLLIPILHQSAIFVGLVVGFLDV
jgi:hypothetical protein